MFEKIQLQFEQCIIISLATNMYSVSILQPDKAQKCVQIF